MNRILAAETVEIRMPGVVDVKLRVADVDGVQRHRCGMGVMVEIDWGVHFDSPWWSLLGR
jgi:hypothetical protein